MKGLCITQHGKIINNFQKSCFSFTTTRKKIKTFHAAAVQLEGSAESICWSLIITYLYGMRLLQRLKLRPTHAAVLGTIKYVSKKL
jgi:hypothetical protein